MTRLVSVELARYRSRRVIALLLLLAALLAALVAAKSAWDTRPITAQEAATARANADDAAPRAGHRGRPGQLPDRPGAVPRHRRNRADVP